MQKELENYCKSNTEVLRNVEKARKFHSKNTNERNCLLFKMCPKLSGTLGWGQRRRRWKPRVGKVTWHLNVFFSDLSWLWFSDLSSFFRS